MTTARRRSFPMPFEELVERTRQLALTDRTWPSQRAVVGAFGVGTQRARAALAALREEGFDPAPSPALTVVPDAPEPVDERTADALADAAPTAPEGAPETSAEAATERPEPVVEALITPAAAADKPTRRDWVTEIGVLLVGIAAAALTTTTLAGLANACGITGWLAWLLPVTVDAAGVVAARVWLRGQAHPDAVRFARALAWVCITVSVVANAAQHGMTAYGITPPWWVVVAVSAIPPAALGACVHLGHLIGRKR
jgi:Protein of unknown function (DUF2637)